MYPGLSKQGRIASTWGRGSDQFLECREAIIRAFKKLRSQNIRTRANYWCCASCAGAGISTLDEKRKEKKLKPYDGTVYWHRQSDEGLRESGNIYIYFCVDAEDGVDHEPKAKAVAEKLVAALKSEDLDVTWDGNTGEAVLVDGFTDKYWDEKKSKDEFKEAVDNAYGIKLGE